MLVQSLSKTHMEYVFHNKFWMMIIFYDQKNTFIQSRFKSRLFGLHAFFAFFRKLIFDKFTEEISCT